MAEPCQLYLDHWQPVTRPSQPCFLICRRKPENINRSEDGEGGLSLRPTICRSLRDWYCSPEIQSGVKQKLAKSSSDPQHHLRCPATSSPDLFGITNRCWPLHPSSASKSSPDTCGGEYQQRNLPRTYHKRTDVRDRPPHFTVVRAHDRYHQRGRQAWHHLQHIFFSNVVLSPSDD